ncbi:hypothetical protein E2562_034715 [Oryza meyeriana var. granulata]|uniref:Uncharacterized protein n=1 Tax=Oryza meyeriana var. granulata TaxID=110450 RepID=A0A6G1CAW7_9ORYZ|nr:hypothetical protein E2562_034715 [Oryza meyeriana var. granulata]
MMTAVAAVVESPSPSPSPARKRCRLGGPVANGETGPITTTSSSDFELRHWRPASKRAGSGMRRRWAPPEIEIPNGGGGGPRGYTSLRDILSSPEYAASSKSSSPADGGSAAAGGGGGDVHMIRHPLVKHAAYAYLQLTPSARDVDAAGRRRRRSRGPLCRLLLGCLGFVGALFGR